MDPETPTNDSVNTLIYGPFGSGKTHAAFTARQPIYMQSFDPNGSELPHVRKMVAEGRAIVNRECEIEDDRRPVALDKFVANFDAMKKAKAFDFIGTYVVDSLTFFCDAVMNKALAEAGRQGTHPQIQDYGRLKALIKRIMANCCTLPCDFVLTGHISTLKDEVTMETITSLLTIGNNNQIIPAYFDEVYVADVSRKDDKPVYRFLTSPNRRYSARTRIGSGVFSQYETPDLMALRKKAGRSVDHLPLLR